MNNILVSIKRFLKNKNTVTIIGIILIIGILYWGYSSQIKSAVNPVKNIPVANQNIQPRTKITDDMIDYIDVASIVFQKGSIIRSKAAIVGKYTNYNTMIPEGSFFYNGVLVNAKDLPDNAFEEVKEGDVPYNFPVDIRSTYGNSVFPGNYIDIYMKAENAAGQIMVGKLVENVKVISVKDSSGKPVFENTDEARTPSMLIFGVNEEINILLRKASYMTAYSVELFPVPQGGTVPTEGETQVSTQSLKDFINANTVPNENIQNTPETEQEPTPTPES